MIFVDPRNPRATVLLREIEARVDLSELPDEIALVIGGDGWMLQTIRSVGPEPVFLGVNAGHLGFLLNDPNDINALCEALARRDFKAVSFPEK